SAAANTTLSGAALKATGATITATGQTLVNVTAGTLSAGKVLDLGGASTLALGSGTAAAIASGATLSLTTGPAVQLAGTARLTSTGDLLTIAGGGTLTNATLTTALVDVAGTGTSPVLSAANLERQRRAHARRRPSQCRGGHDA